MILSHSWRNDTCVVKSLSPALWLHFVVPSLAIDLSGDNPFLIVESTVLTEVLAAVF